MFGCIFKPINMIMNLLPFVLVIWGFYQMVWGMNQAGATYTFYHFVTEITCSRSIRESSEAGQTFFDNCRPGGPHNWKWTNNVQVTDLTKAEEDMEKAGLAFCLVFGFLNVIWILLYLKNSGLIYNSWGTIGYHAANVKSMKQPLYKYFGYFITFFLVCCAIYGISALGDSKQDTETAAEEDQQNDQLQKQYVTFFNGIFQCLLGLIALMSPVPDTIKYGEKIMQCKVNAKPWQASRGVMEKFQDALAAARGGDNGYLIDLTNCKEIVPED